MIDIRHVTKRHRVDASDFTALDDVSLTIKRGEIFGIIGRSGAGKSTLLRLLNHLDQPSSGQVILDGIDIGTLRGEALRHFRQRFGFVFQQDNLLSSKTVRENVRLPLRVVGRQDAHAQFARVREVLNLVGIADQSDKYPSALSGGQRQRVGIARALANQPDVLLCDEATSALDPETTDSILQLLLSIHRELKLTIVLVTHSMHVIRRLADRVAVLDRGRLVESGEVAQVFLRPQHPVTRALLTESDFEAAATVEGAPSSQRRVLQLTYHGPLAETALLTRLAADAAVHFSILSGSAGRLKDVAYGQFTVSLADAGEAELQRFISLCDARGIAHELVST